MVIAFTVSACESNAPMQHDANAEEVAAFFKTANKRVLTFIGYSGAEYEDKAAMLEHARQILTTFDPQKTIVNIGATAEGIGAVYEEAKRQGFTTTGIVSSQARVANTPLSPYVDRVFYIKDDTWGGLLEGTTRLAPTSAAMVDNSDIIVAIGGDTIGRDELLAAKALGKEVRFIPAEMNHQKAVEKAKKKGLPPPTDFRGAAHTALSTPGESPH
jgi:hypothetical protein